VHIKYRPNLVLLAASGLIFSETLLLTRSKWRRSLAVTGRFDCSEKSFKGIVQRKFRSVESSVDQ
jgi:hypothetical protein